MPFRHGGDQVGAGGQRQRRRKAADDAGDRALQSQGGQGVVFTADSRTLLAQFNVDKQLAVFRIEGGRLKDDGERIAVPGGPVSIRSMPR